MQAAVGAFAVTGTRSSSNNGTASSPTATAAAAVGAAAGAAASASKAAWVGAAQAVQTSMPGAVKRASFAGMVNTFLKLVKDAAARHNSVMITPDITGWFFVISTHSEELKKQQLGQLQQLMWFSREQRLQRSMQQGALGTNQPGVVLKGAAAALAALEASKQHQEKQEQQKEKVSSSQPAAAADGAGNTTASSNPLAGSSSTQRRQDSTAAASAAGSQHVLKGLPFPGLTMHIGSSGSSTRSSSGSSKAPAGSATAAAGNSAGSSSGPAGVQLHVGQLTMLDYLLAGAQYAQAAYGYVAAAGHLSNLGNAIKMLATLPHFNAITGKQCWTTGGLLLMVLCVWT